MRGSICVKARPPERLISQLVGRHRVARQIAATLCAWFTRATYIDTANVTYGLAPITTCVPIKGHDRYTAGHSDRGLTTAFKLSPNRHLDLTQQPIVV